MEWRLKPGETLSRIERSETYGGGRQGGIQPSATTPNVFLYSDPEAAEKHGYTFDGWVADDLYLYTGEGPGDQQFTRGNKALRHHREDGRALRLFLTRGKVQGKDEKIQHYIGEFELDTKKPYIRASAPDREENGSVPRSVIVFRLRPIGSVRRMDDDESSFADVEEQQSVISEPVLKDPPDLLVDGTALEIVGTVEFAVDARAAGVARRREAELVTQFQEHLTALGHQVERFRIRPPNELKYLHTDIYDRDANVLYEAKATAVREAIRMAIGQLFDYVRYLPSNPRKAVLLPSEPTTDCHELLKALDIGCVWLADGEFKGSA